MINDTREVGIIYGWYCIPTEKWYIGQTIHPEARFKQHIDRAINKKYNTYFYNSIRKYGLANFVYCVLEENVLINNLNLREIEWIEYYDSFYSGYNMTLGGEGVKGQIREKNHMYGKHHSEEVKEKISKSNSKKIIQYNLSGEFIQMFNSALEVTKTLNINNGNISSCCKGKLAQAGGFIWKYV